MWVVQAALCIAYVIPSVERSFVSETGAELFMLIRRSLLRFTVATKGFSLYPCARVEDVFERCYCK